MFIIQTLIFTFIFLANSLLKTKAGIIYSQSKWNLMPCHGLTYLLSENYALLVSMAYDCTSLALKMWLSMKSSKGFGLKMLKEDGKEEYFCGRSFYCLNVDTQLKWVANKGVGVFIVIAKPLTNILEISTCYSTRLSLENSRTSPLGLSTCF